jgi:hypothetical protein
MNLKIKELLLAANCCLRCVLRYTAIRDINIHMAQEQPTKVCPACLGLLQLNHTQISNAGWDMFKQKNFMIDTNTFSLSIALPPQLIIRQKSLTLHILQSLQYYCYNLRCKLEELPELIDTKEIFKLLIKESFIKISSLEFDINSPISFIFKMTHDETELDWKFMTEIPHSKFNVAKKRKLGRTIYQGASIDRISNALKLLSYEDFKNYRQCPPTNIETFPIATDMNIEHTQIYVAGY